MFFKGRSTLAYFFLSVFLAAGLACSLSTSEGQGDADAIIQTNVAGTLAAERDDGGAAQTTETPPQPLAIPTQTALTPAAPEPDVVYGGISFSYDESLLGALKIVREEGVLEEDHPWKLPAHTSFVFEEYMLPAAFHQAQVRVFPVDAFKSVNPEAGAQIDRMAGLLASNPVDPGAFYVAHFWNAMRYFIAQADTVEFQNGRGVRYISQYGQAAYPVGYPHMFYTFQGLTDDNAYYVSVILPISHPSLPDTEGVTLDQNFYDNWQNYLEQTRQLIDNQAPGSFVPSLLKVDAMVESLRVESD